MQLNTVILMEPVPKGRAKVAVVKGHAQVYTPQKTVKSEAQVITEIRHSLGNVQPFPQGAPVRLIAIFYRSRPKNLAKKVLKPVQQPDLDNYLKLLKDALDGFAFPNDSQVTTTLVKKRFAEPGTFPRIEFLLEDDDGD